MDFNLAWMAWTWQTATFFVVIALLIATMGLWEWLQPGGGPAVVLDDRLDAHGR